MSQLNSFYLNVKNYLSGRTTNRKIVVIESDDWGTIRMSSKKSWQRLLGMGYPVDNCPYNSNDSLESNNDLLGVLEVLDSVKDSKGKSAVLTVNNIVGNPDFNRIKQSDFSKYFFEPFTETLKSYPAHNNVMELYFQGISSNLLKPQFHGREHLNIQRWMASLQKKSKPEMDAFDQNIFSPKLDRKQGYVNEYMDALDLNSKDEINQQKIIIEEGLRLFKEIWGFESKSFIAPCYIWHSELESVLSKNGVKYIQGLINQLEPTFEIGFRYNKKYHYQGQKNWNNQRYFFRNSFFEPTIKPLFDWEGDCMRRINMAFMIKKPAIISTHRLNFIGSLNPVNRDENLKRFKKLLNRIVTKWPDVEFVSSDQLGEIYDLI